MIALSMFGIAVIVTMESTIGQGSTASRPIGLALLSSVMFAGVMLSIRHLRGADVAWLGLVNYLVSSICLAPMVIGTVPMPVGFQWVALFGLGSVQLAIPYMLFAWAVRDVPSNEASLIALIEPIGVPIWTFLAWRHLTSYRPPDWWTFVGAALIAAGLIWRYGRRG
jgi:drug/metabolite transporter (DMT)-like permease